MQPKGADTQKKAAPAALGENGGSQKAWFAQLRRADQIRPTLFALSRQKPLWREPGFRAGPPPGAGFSRGRKEPRDSGRLPPTPGAFCGSSPWPRSLLRGEIYLEACLAENKSDRQFVGMPAFKLRKSPQLLPRNHANTSRLMCPSFLEQLFLERIIYGKCMAQFVAGTGDGLLDLLAALVGDGRYLVD